ncbi:MAG TPA: hypothetical protein VFJ70_11195 [Burkholderiales bacterium]|nr:hypothetical protein [Burkholderiales bacterium]
MLDPAALERRFDDDLPAKPDALAQTVRKPVVTRFQLVLAVMCAVAALAVVIAAVRITDESMNRAVDAREAPERFLRNELSALRLMAMSSPSPVPGRLYLGIEECFKQRVAVPFDDEHLADAKQTLATCADMEIGRLYAQGGAALAERGRSVLRDAAVSTLGPR